MTEGWEWIRQHTSAFHWLLCDLLNYDTYEGSVCLFPRGRLPLGLLAWGTVVSGWGQFTSTVRSPAHSPESLLSVWGVYLSRNIPVKHNTEMELLCWGLAVQRKIKRLKPQRQHIKRDLFCVYSQTFCGTMGLLLKLQKSGWFVMDSQKMIATELTTGG